MAKHEQERLSFQGGVEFRDVAPESATKDTIGTIRGVASVFDTETRIGSIFGEFIERVAPDAFDGALNRPDDVRALFNHDPGRVLGRTAAGTLRLSKTERGLTYEVDVPDTQTGHEVRSLIRRGDITGSSFGFKVPTKDDETWDDDASPPIRTIRNVELFDVSPVTYPAYPETSVEARSHADAILGGDRTVTKATDARVARLRSKINEDKSWTLDG